MDDKTRETLTKAVEILSVHGINAKQQVKEMIVELLEDDYGNRQNIFR